MSLFENFPYTNLHNLNLDWIIQKIAALDEKFDQAISSKIKLADPLQWDISKQYEAYTIAMNNDYAYLSIKPVPYGIQITDTDYWQEIFDLGLVFNTLKEAIAIADDGLSTVSSADRSVGSLVWLNDKLNIVIQPISLGDTYTSSNVREASVEELIRITKDQIFAEINSLAAYTNNELAKKVTKYNNGKYIIIGDSYVVLGLGAQIKTILSLDAIVFPAGGGGFAGTAGTYTFQTALEAVANTLTADEKNAITDIIVLGGYNDYSFQASAITTAMQNFNTYARATFSKALITLGMVAYSTRDSDLGLIEEVVIPTYSSNAMVLGWRYIPYANACIHFTSAMDSDGVHPISGGISSIAYYVAQFIHTGNAFYSARMRDYIHTEKLATSGDVYIDTRIDNGICSAILTTSGYVFAEDYEFANLNGFASATLIGHIDGFMRGNLYNGIPSIAIPVQIQNVWVNNASFEDCNGILYIVNGNVYLAMKRKYPNHTGSFVTKSFTIPNISFTMASDHC